MVALLNEWFKRLRKSTSSHGGIRCFEFKTVSTCRRKTHGIPLYSIPLYFLQCFINTNPTGMMWPFKWNLFACTYRSLHIILLNICFSKFHKMKFRKLAEIFFWLNLAVKGSLERRWTHRYLCFDLLKNLCGEIAFLFGLATLSLWLQRNIWAW